MINIKDKHNCCGCASCAQRCPKHCISMHTDDEGFLYPEVDTEKCIDCGLCEKACPILHDNEEHVPIESYAAKNPSEKERMSSSSGGIFVLLAKQILSQGGVIFGAILNSNLEVVHTHIDTLDDLVKLQKSKYVQSRIGSCYEEVETFLKNGRKVLFSGTPCQIAGLKHFLGKDYHDLLLTIDVVCHGVPSPGVWSRFVKELNAASKAAAGKNSLFSSLKTMPVITDINFRDKMQGWQKFAFSLQFGEATAEAEKNTLFPPVEFNNSHWGKAFVQNMFLRPSCHHCQFKCLRSNSDITLGDFWGINKKLPLFNDDKGVSAVLLNTKHGQDLFGLLNTESIPIEYKDVIEGNMALVKSWEPSKNRNLFFIGFQKGKSVTKLINQYDTTTPSMVKSKIKNIFTPLKKLKRQLRNAIECTEFIICKLLTSAFKSNLTERRCLLVPAASIDGGFGEDIMVAGFLNGSTFPVTILSTQIEHREFIEKHKNVRCSTLLMSSFKYFRMLTLFSRHTDLYIIGADILDGVYTSNKLRFNLIDLAHRMGLRVHITSFSVREKSSSYFIKQIQRISSYVQINARDIESQKRLQVMLPNVDVRLVPDIAFLCDNPSPNDELMEKWSNEQRKLGHPVIAYCPNTIQAKKMGLNKYIEGQIELLREFKRYKCAIMFMYHDLRKYALSLSDKDLSRIIYLSLNDSDSVFIDNVSNGYDLKKYIALSDFTVTGRMHFGISGYTMGLPMFGVSYFNKFEGLHKMFLQSNSLIEYDNVEQCHNNVGEFIANFQQYNINVRNRLFQIIEIAKMNF